MITVVGSFNMDLFIEAPRFPAPGEAIAGKNFRRASGGKGANQASVIGKMGMPAAIIGAVGADAFGDEMVAGLQAVGVDVSGVVHRSDVPSGTAMIILDASGQNQIVVANGANDTLTATDVEQRESFFRRSRAVVAQLETPLESVTTALRLGRKHGAMTVLNPAPFTPVSDDVLRLADWIIPNEGEAEKLAQSPVKDTESAAAAARAIRKRSNAAGVIVTMGAHGAWLETKGFSGLVPAPAVTAVDTVGAGDTFIGAFVTRLVEGAVAFDAAQFAVTAASIAVTRRGAQASIPERGEVEALLRSSK